QTRVRAVADAARAAGEVLGGERLEDARLLALAGGARPGIADEGHGDVDLARDAAEGRDRVRQALLLGEGGREQHAQRRIGLALTRDERQAVELDPERMDAQA